MILCINYGLKRVCTRVKYSHTNVLQRIGAAIASEARYRRQAQVQKRAERAQAEISLQTSAKKLEGHERKHKLREWQEDTAEQNRQVRCS